MPDRVYTLTYKDMPNGTITTEVVGQDILNMFRRQTYLDELLKDLSTDKDISE